jgi:hypothetical protein
MVRFRLKGWVRVRVGLCAEMVLAEIVAAKMVCGRDECKPTIACGTTGIWGYTFHLYP